MKVLCVVEATADGPCLPPAVFRDTPIGRKAAKEYFQKCIVENCGERNFGGEHRYLTPAEKTKEAAQGWQAREWSGWGYTVAARTVRVQPSLE